MLKQYILFFLSGILAIPNGTQYLLSQNRGKLVFSQHLCINDTQFKENEKWCKIHNCRYKIGNRKIKSLSLQPKSRFSRLRQTKKILSEVLKDRKIRKRQLNVI